MRGSRESPEVRRHNHPISLGLVLRLPPCDFVLLGAKIVECTFEDSELREAETGIYVSRSAVVDRTVVFRGEAIVGPHSRVGQVRRRVLAEYSHPSEYSIPELRFEA